MFWRAGVLFWGPKGSPIACTSLIKAYGKVYCSDKIFVSDLQDVNKKIIFLNKFFCLLLFKGSFTSFFKDKKS